jgi:hypothetical protein
MSVAYTYLKCVLDSFAQHTDLDVYLLLIQICFAKLIIVPCARDFSLEATIYVRGFLDMRILPFFYPHPS